MKIKSLKHKIIFASLLVTTLVVAVVTSVMYLTQIKPLPQQVKQQLTNDMQVFMDSQIELKVQSGIIGATMLSQQPILIDALANNRQLPLRQVLANQQQHYASVTNFRGIFSEIYDANGQSLLRSWALDQQPAATPPNALITEVINTKTAQGALGFTDRGVTITAVTPVLNSQQQLMGLVSMLQGVGSISRDFDRIVGGNWIMLVDSEYVRARHGHTQAIDRLININPRYVVANNNWFTPETIQLTQSLFQATHGDKTNVYLNQGYLIVDLPAYDEAGQVMGRQLFIQDEQVFTHILSAAYQQVTVTIIGVILGILILAGILFGLILRLVIRPLEDLTTTMHKIDETGDFSIRVAVKSDDEVGQTAQAINHHLVKVSDAITQANTAIAAIAKGDLTTRIEGHYVGNLLELKTGVNASANNMQNIIEEIARALEQLNQGQFNFRTKVQAQGAFATILADTENAMSQLNLTMTDIGDVVKKMAAGQFNLSINRELQGQLKELKDDINLSLASLNEVIKDISRVMQAQSQGDLTQSVTQECQGDLATLKEAINQSLAQMTEVINEVLVSSKAVASAAEEVSHGSISLSDSVQQQAASVEQTSAAMTEIDATIKNNAEHSKTADHLQHQLETQSLQASNVMKQTIDSMAMIQQSSNQIHDIVSLIESIAFQTNLLALNAAVEAARAGEHGRGFAVVASEVRALAQKSAEAAKEITGLVTNSVNRINQGTEHATESAEIISKMHETINHVTDMLSDIANASMEQAQGVSEINQAIGLIDNVTQQNAALVEETAAAAESMKDQAQQLSQSVSFFKTHRIGTKRLN
ncbi:chemotaxis protein [Thiomicrospira aerophila AL3]|uniref:Chemotaxis protein n=1 Tax=Thiomicrospira aerophila AL3 TaxID=717772 RepID=W0DP38_9GAMM|nr:methyl-accepting chemotaxis protein [Thiomicrospira aerophila]AHF00370.1 chemotaxis protein [Thiomicrospira aerophila AL3]